MASLLGSRIQRADGVGGVIVNAQADSMWRAGKAYVYDVVWEDRTFARKVMPEAISREGWSLQGGRVDPAECNRMWSEYQVERSRQMTARYAGPARAQPHPIEVSRHKRLAQLSSVQPVVLPVEEASRPASWHARHILARAMPEMQFAVSMDHRKLTVGWLDGPVETRVLRALEAIRSGGLADKFVLRRGVQAHLVQASIDHVLTCVWSDPSLPGARSDRMRLPVEDFQAGLSGSVMTPPACPLGSIPYSTLIRCIIDRWDDGLLRFVDTERTRYLLQERAFLFPDGDDVAATKFADLTRCARERFTDAREFAGNLGHVDRARG